MANNNNNKSHLKMMDHLLSRMEKAISLQQKQLWRLRIEKKKFHHRLNRIRNMWANGSFA